MVLYNIYIKYIINVLPIDTHICNICNGIFFLRLQIIVFVSYIHEPPHDDVNVGVIVLHISAYSIICKMLDTKRKCRQSNTTYLYKSSDLFHRHPAFRS